MTKINFNKIPARTNPFAEDKTNVSFATALIGYLWNKQGNTAMEAKFALSLVDVDPETEVEITDEQKAMVKDFAEKSGIPYFARVALLEALGEKVED